MTYNFSYCYLPIGMYTLCTRSDLVFITAVILHLEQCVEDILKGVDYIRNNYLSNE